MANQFPLIPPRVAVKGPVASISRTSMAAQLALGGSSTVKPGKPPLTGYAGGGNPTGAASAAGPSAVDSSAIPDGYATGDYGGIPVSPVAANIQQRLANGQIQATDQGATITAPTDDEVTAENERKKKIAIAAVAGVVVIGLGAYAYSEYAKGQKK